jgi:hypothetical protein
MTERDELLAALDACLASLEEGASLDSVLAGHPALAAELRPLLLAAQSAGAGAELSRVPVGAQAESRSQFLAGAGLRGGAADRRPAIVPAGGQGWWSRLRSPLNSRQWAGSSLLARAVTIILVVAAGLGAGTYGAVAASAQSLPGDALYGVKRAVENTQLMLAPDEQTRAGLQAEFDGRRVREAQAVANQGRQVPVEFTGTLVSMDGAQSQHWIVSGVAVVVGPQVPVDGEPVIGAQVRIQGAVATVGVVQAQRVTVLPHHAGAPDATPTATATAQATAYAAATGTATIEPAQFTATPQATSQTPIGATASAAPSNTPQPSATQVASSTDDHGGPSPSNTPEATEGGGGDNGGENTETPEATQGGGGAVSETPEPTENGGDHSGGGPSPSNTPKPTDSSGGGPSPSNTPKPDN